MTAAILLVSSYAAIPECSTSDDDQESYAEIHADPDNCGAYYECAHGIAYEELCPDGLLYNTVLQVCDYAENVDCGTRPVTPTPFTDSTDYWIEKIV